MGCACCSTSGAIHSNISAALGAHWCCVPGCGAVYPGVLPGKATAAAKAQVVALPYYIPNFMSDAQLKKMESQSLELLATRFAAASVLGAPTRAIMLELILASNGAQLSGRFLKQLCALCKDWAVNVVIDEVMTSARCSGELLLAFTLGLSGCFSHAVIGKWPSIGVVFRSCAWPATETPDCRGETTVAAAANAAFDIVKSFNRMQPRLLGLIAATRDSTIAALRASVLGHARDKVGTELEVWGCGCLIFCNVHAGGRGAWSPHQDFLLTAGRYLPRVHLPSQGGQLLQLRNMQLLAQFPLEQQARLETMFNEWLQNGQQAAGYEELHGLHACALQSGRLFQVGEYQKRRVGLQSVELVRFEKKKPVGVTPNLQDWVKAHRDQLYGKNVRKGSARLTYRPYSTLMDTYRRNRQGIYAPGAPARTPRRTKALTLHHAHQGAGAGPKDSMCPEQYNHEVAAGLMCADGE